MRTRRAVAGGPSPPRRKVHRGGRPTQGGADTLLRSVGRVCGCFALLVIFALVFAQRMRDGSVATASLGVGGVAERRVDVNAGEITADLAARIAAIENPPPPPAAAVPLELEKSVLGEHGASFPTGYVRKPQLRMGDPSNPRLKGDDGKLHIIFSSGCNYFQHWQAEMVLATAFKVGQRGRITRIVSGCHDVSAENVDHHHQTFPSGLNDRLVPLAMLNRSVNPYFGLYVTPSFDGAKDFPWINKPSGIHHFLKHAAPEMARLGETVVAILDPDFIFLKPLTQTGEALADIIYDGPASDEKGALPRLGMDIVRPGRPVAQRYGLGGQWVHKFDVAGITGDPKSHALSYDDRAAGDLFSVGPPMMIHVDDALPLAALWKQCVCSCPFRAVLHPCAHVLHAHTPSHTRAAHIMRH